MADPPSSLTLTELRRALDGVDDRLLALLNERARLVQQVGTHKQGSTTPFYVPERERQILERLKAENAGPFPDDALAVVMQEVIGACLSLEEGQQVAFLGPAGTFTHLAVLQRFGSSARAVPCGTIGAVFDEVERGATQFGVVPVENSSHGSVTHTLDSFSSSSLKIVGEILVPVEHALMVRPGTAEGDVARVHSHPQALAQCRQWLGKNMAHAALVESTSTAEAARACRTDPGGAAIASSQAARLHGLTVLRSAIQDIRDNATRFLVLAKADRARGPSGADKTSVMLALPHRSGALFEVLEPLSKAGINLSKIESRPSLAARESGDAWQYVFFLDLDGHADEQPLAAALADVGSRCPLFAVLGAYAKAPSSD